MATEAEIEQALHELAESHERMEAKIDRLLQDKEAPRRRRSVVVAPQGPLPGTKRSRRAAAEAFGLRATKGR